MDVDEIFIWIKLKLWVLLHCKFSRTLFSFSYWCLCPCVY